MVINSNEHTAYLGNEGRYTIFRFGDQRLKFVGPYSLEKYTDIVEWDHGYLVVKAKYSHNRQPIEEYIDLLPVLDHLMMDRDEFLNPIQKVEVLNDKYSGIGQ